MKFIVFFALIAVASAADKDGLLAQAGKLKDLAGPLISQLLANGKPVIAHELQVLDDSLIALEKRVEAQHPTTELGKIALEAEEVVLKGLEHKLEDFIHKVGGSFYAETKDQLIADASKLKSLAAAEIAKLTAGGKDVLAKELKVIDDAVIALEKRVEAQQPTTEAGKIALHAEETVLKGLEEKLSAFLKKVGGSFFDDTKDTLIADASKLKSLAGAEIAQLLAAGKGVLAKELQVLEDSVIALEKRVEAQHPTTEIGKIALEAEETVLKGLEHKLEEFIKKNAAGTFYDNTKDTLIADASKLKSLASGEIAQLLAAGKGVLAKELQVLEDSVIALEKRVEAQHPTTEIGKIALEAEETVLKGLEHKLEEFIKKNAAGSFYDNTKDTLIADASKLKTLASGEIAQLLAAGKGVLAKELQVLEDAVIALEKRVETQQPTTEIGKIALQAEETVLKGLEHKLEDFIKKNAAGTFFDDTKDTLIADASKLKNLASGEIAQLLAAGKGVLAKELQVLEDAVVALEKRVEAQHPTTEIGKIALEAEETVLKGLEHKLEDFIKKNAAPTL